MDDLHVIAVCMLAMTTFTAVGVVPGCCIGCIEALCGSKR
uniref:p6 n=1 Tax=Barley yellow dwarf virus (isolate PAV) TaxID=2169986 RepID=A5A337_BYDVP|nr:P6 [Barley yellow dwarf virus PAV]